MDEISKAILKVVNETNEPLETKRLDKKVRKKVKITRVSYPEESIT
jgi:hypothetical protein